MATFFSTDMSPSSEATKMCIGECYNLIGSGELSVPGYQREYVWSKKQQQSYLESLSLGLPLFGPVINIDTESGQQWIMDGQNRLMTIFKFMNDEITFENEYEEWVKYSELPDNEKRKIKNTKISYTETRDWTQEQCQEFFTIIQEGVPLKNGELIHAKPGSPFTQQIVRILTEFPDLFTNKPKYGGMGLTPAMVKRYGHYEIIGTIIHMIRTDVYPGRPGKTSLKEFNQWVNDDQPTRSQREICITETIECLSKYSEIIMNVPRLKLGVKVISHLRLLYFIYKTGYYKNTWTDTEYTKIENLLNRVENKDNVEHAQIVTFGTLDAVKIYDLYVTIYTE